MAPAMLRRGPEPCWPRSFGRAPTLRIPAGSEELGVQVNFDVTLEGLVGRRADVRWSLYHADGGGRVRYPWLIRHRVLRLKGEVDSDTGSGDFWVPLPKLRGPFKVRIEVFRDDGSKLTFKDTRPFS
jgi:hypothetical protein